MYFKPVGTSRSYKLATYVLKFEYAYPYLPRAFLSVHTKVILHFVAFLVDYEEVISETWGLLGYADKRSYLSEGDRDQQAPQQTRAHYFFLQ